MSHWITGKPPGQVPTNVYLENITWADTNLQLCFLPSTSIQVNMKNVHGVCAQAFDELVGYGLYDNVTVDCVFNGITNNVNGGQDIQCNGNCVKTIRGGTYTVSGFDANTNAITASYATACLWMTGSNSVTLQGPRFYHYGTNSYAIYNYLGEPPI